MLISLLLIIIYNEVCVCVCCLKNVFVLEEIISISFKVNMKWDSQLILLQLLDVFPSEYVGHNFILYMGIDWIVKTKQNGCYVPDWREEVEK